MGGTLTGWRTPGDAARTVVRGRNLWRLTGLIVGLLLGSRRSRNFRSNGIWAA